MKLINLTPHDIKVFYPESAKEKRYFITIEKSGMVARVSTQEKIIGYIPMSVGTEEFFEQVLIPVKSIKYGKVEGLPNERSGVLYIVSSMVREALKEIRDDVISPDTGKSAVRDSEGNILGVTGFISNV